MAEKHAGLSVWHMTMMALGTVVGGSFFLGSAIAIRTAGPAILLSFILGGVLVYIILSALSEMTVSNPTAGSFRTHAENMYGPAAGFIIGWVYWTGLTLAMSSEATAASVFIRSWIPGVSLPVMAITIVIAVTLVNLVGARTLSNLESGLAFIKLAAIAGFIVIAVALVLGLFPGRAPVGFGVVPAEPLFPAGLAGIAGSMLIVMFSYAGFEVIGLAASEAGDPHRTVPRAIKFTIVGLVALYCLAISLLLPLVRTAGLKETVSPLVAGLTSAGLGWAGGVINAVLVTAILSTMLAAMFGMGRMIRSLAEVGYAPLWLKENREIPVRGILFSGTGMLAGVILAFLLPKQIYLFLVSSGGFSLLFTYVIIMATHYKYRKVHGCPPKGNCQLWGYPYTTILGLMSLIAVIISMPLIPGQGSGLLAGLFLVGMYVLLYIVFKAKFTERAGLRMARALPLLDMEASEDLSPEQKENSNCKKGEPKERS
ncbi:MAG TPA: amino acid permease [Desulfobacteria bacterium]|nr:amino acid permease [Desulfobacteria bacterium]